MKYLLGVDFGGSSSKATLLGEDGRVYGTASEEYPTYYPHNGWAEQDPDDSYQALTHNIRALLASSGVFGKKRFCPTLLHKGQRTASFLFLPVNMNSVMRAPTEHLCTRIPPNREPGPI